MFGQGFDSPRLHYYPYDLIDVSTNDIVYSADDIDDLIQEINKRLKEN